MADQRARQHKSLSRQLRAFLFLLAKERQSRLAQIAYQLAIVFIGEKLHDALRDSRPDFVHFLKFLRVRVHDRVQRSEVFCQKLGCALAHEPYSEAVDHALEWKLLRRLDLREHVFR